jgi:tetraacyldisaccharide 4'-kinase
MRGWIEKSISGIWFPEKSTDYPYLSTFSQPFLWLFNCLSEPIISRKSKRQSLAKIANTSQKKPVVIVIGNLVVGGAGKTPLTLALGNLLSSKGLRVGYLASGYGSAAYEEAQLITNQSIASDVGDEALLIYRKSKSAVGVGKDRLKALNLLIETTELDIVISDDGLQHEALPRALEIAVFDERFAGNGRLLPSGPLREPLTRLASVDVVFAPEERYGEVNRFIDLTETDLCSSTWQLSGFRLLKDYAEFGDDVDHAPLTNIATFCEIVSGKELHAIAGMASPKKLLDTLQNASLTATLHAPGDHAQADQTLLKQLQSFIIVMTEKDAVKYMQLLGSSEFDLNHCWVAVGNAYLSQHCVDTLWRRVEPHLPQQA